jgi:L-aminopeptidase/D-esterase-like protein
MAALHRPTQGVTIGFLNRVPAIRRQPIFSALRKSHSGRVREGCLGAGYWRRCMVLIATDAPLDSQGLRRIATDATRGFDAVGTTISRGSVEYVMAFSTSESVPVPFKSSKQIDKISVLRDEPLKPLFQAVRGATEEAIIQSILRATTTSGYSGARIEAIELSDNLRILSEHGRTPLLP